MKRRATADFYLGVEGGGAACRARLQAAGGTILGEGAGGPANVRLGQELAWRNILSAIDAAVDASGLGRDVLKQTAAGLGLAGYLKPSDFAPGLAKALHLQSLHVSSDAHTACLGAFGGEDGAIQIIGTGSSGYAIIDGIGQSRGGWGFALKERASAASLGRDALCAALEASDGMGVATPFTRAIIAEFGTTTDIVDWSDTARPKDYAALTPLVFRYARLRDPAALALVRHLAAECGGYVTALVRLGAPGVCLLGGLASQIRPWLQPHVVEHLASPKADALAGALLMARQAQPASALQGIPAE